MSSMAFTPTWVKKKILKNETLPAQHFRPERQTRSLYSNPIKNPLMLVLGIETSCDETSVALVRDGTTVVGVRTLSQVKTHEAFGGVVPEIASRMHVEHLHLLLTDLLNEHSTDPQTIDLIAATNCPGLMGALLVGVSFANALAYAWNKPVIGINHLEGHIYGACMQDLDNLSYPACILLVSGGHTQLLLMKKIGSYQLLGQHFG